MARLDPAADPLSAIRDGLYVPRPSRSTADEVAARLSLSPTSSHLIIGGIGSGKTTQLLVACNRLSQLADTRAVYVDVSLVHDLSHMAPGTLIVAGGMAAGELLERGDDANAREAYRQFKRWGRGYLRRVWVSYNDHPDEPPDDGDNEEPDGHYEFVKEKPLLSSPEKPIDRTVSHKAQHLSAIRDGLRARYPNLVLVFDSLDRLPDPAAFATAVEQDVRAIQKAGIGVVVVGPLRSMFGPHRTVTDYFQHFYPLPAVDVQRDERGRAFLVEVLRRRAPEDLLPDAACARLAEFSGGVLRDLLALACGVVEEAFMRDADHVEAEHVDVVADAFGRQLIFGLSPKEIEALQRVRQKGTFVPTSDDDMALLMTRRILEYRTETSRFSVHPTLEPLLGQMSVGGEEP
jgi:hypothetical protein